MDILKLRKLAKAAKEEPKKPKEKKPSSPPDPSPATKPTGAGSAKQDTAPPPAQKPSLKELVAQKKKAQVKQVKEVAKAEQEIPPPEKHSAPVSTAEPANADSAAPAKELKKGPAPPETESTSAIKDDQDLVDILAFLLADRMFGLQIEEVQEVTRIPDITRVPNVPSYFAGVMNLRGNITPVVDLRQRFGFSAREQGEESRVIVFQVKGQPVGLLVDRIDKIYHVPRRELQSTSPMIQGVNQDYIKAVIHWAEEENNREGLLILLNVENIFPHV